ncbi:MAG: FtsX-like permease family protein [Bryobacteraceae bacterium]
MTARLVLENLRHRPLRTLLSIFLIAVPVTLMLTVVGISRGLLDDSARRARGVGADIVVRPPGTAALNLSGAPMSQKLVDVLREEPHVAIATGTIVHLLSGVTTISGLNLDEFTRMSGGFHFLTGGPFKNPDDIIVDAYYARQNNLRVGDTLNVLNRDWRVSGIFEPGKLGRIFLPMHILQDLTSNTGKITQVYLKLDDPKNLETVLASLRQRLEGYPVYSMEELVSLLTVDSVPQVKTFLNVVIGIAIVIGFAVVFLSMYTAILQRTREIGILKALGASKGYVLDIILREAFVLSLAGTVLGIVMSFGSRWLIQALVPASLTQAIVPEWWPIAALISLTGALLGALYPGITAATQDPIEALAYE